MFRLAAALALAGSLVQPSDAVAKPRELSACPGTTAAADALLAGLPRGEARPGKQRGWHWYPEAEFRVVGARPIEVSAWPDGATVDQLLFTLSRKHAGRLEEILRKQYPGDAFTCNNGICSAREPEWRVGKLHSSTLVTAGNGELTLTCAYSSGW